MNFIVRFCVNLINIHQGKHVGHNKNFLKANCMQWENSGCSCRMSVMMPPGLYDNVLEQSSKTWGHLKVV